MFISAPARSRAPGFRLLLAGLGLLLVLGTGCQALRPGSEARRRGDEIIACGRLFHTGTPVVTWLDPGGYDAYRVERRFAPWPKSDWEGTAAEGRQPATPNRYGLRRDQLSSNQLERVRGGGWSLPELQERVDQFVLHFDATGTSRRCFEVLHDLRGLSVHFLLDVDGTIYQTLDLKERAWHATTSNSRSIGVEIAQAGAYPPVQRRRLEPWYAHDARGVRLTFPAWVTPTGIRTPGFIGRPARPDPILGTIQGQELIQYDFTPEQYAALARLAAALGQVFPRLRLDFPRDAAGRVVREKLPDPALQNYAGILGHYHVQTDKVDPGPAFDWDRLQAGIRSAQRRRFLRPP